jgi:RNA polymerase sigma-70 factor, ECF subfamily
MSRRRRGTLCVPGAKPDTPVSSSVESAQMTTARVDGLVCQWPRVAPDTLLARLAARGDERACQELMRRYQDRVYSVAYGFVRDREEALDITQETFLQMLEALPRFREQASFFTWLHRIALNRCIDWGRSRRRRPQPVSLDDLVAEGWLEPADRQADWRPDQALMAKELNGQIQSAIAAVPEVFRSVVVLADVEGLSILEIANRLCCPVNTVKTRLHRGRRYVRQRLQPYLESGA